MTLYRTSPLVRAVATPPIADVQGWLHGRTFPPDRPLLDVSQAVPSYRPATELREHLREVLDEADTALYTSIVGIDSLRAGLATHLSEDYQGCVRSDQVAITAGCNQAFSVAMDTLAVPGDEIVLPVPYYFNHHMWLEMRGLQPVHVHSGDDGRFELDEFARSIGERTRAIILVNPDNPTGREHTPGFISELYALARDRGVALVIDETYKDFRDDPSPPHVLFQQPDWDTTFVHLHSFSKSYAMTGYRAGALVAHPSFIESAEKVLDCTTICASHIAQRAASFALQHLAPWRREKAAMMQERMTVLRDCFKSNALRYQLVSSGAYFGYVRHPFESSHATTVARRLADDFNILCLPGSMFGERQERHLRFAFANLDAEVIPELVDRLVQSQD